MSRVATPLLVAALLVVVGRAGAIDLGVIGPTYEISEPHLLAFIEKRLREKERSGELQRLAEAARARGIDTVRQPPPVEGLRTTERPRTFYVDPSFTLDRNILGPRGELLFAAGARKNPLALETWSPHLPSLLSRARLHVSKQIARIRFIRVVS